MLKRRANSKSPRLTTYSSSSSAPAALHALRSSPPSLRPADGERIAREVYGLAGSIGALPGERDCNFRLRTADAREFVLKVLDVVSDPGSADCLVAVLDHLAEQDPTLPGPRVLPTVTWAA